MWRLQAGVRVRRTVLGAATLLVVAGLIGCVGGRMDPPPAHSHVVIFEATGSTERAWLAWAVFGPVDQGPVGARIELPWKRTLVTPRGDSGQLTAWSMSVGDQTTGGTFSCSIIVDGRRVASDRAVGSASCEADVREG